MSGYDNLQSIEDALARNRRVFQSLQDDEARDAWYRELRDAGCAALRIKSLLGPDRPGWPLDDLYLISARGDVNRALEHGSVEPYRTIPQAGRFMLGLDDLQLHDPQNAAARQALRFTGQDIERCVEEAWRLASVLPLKSHAFDLADLAQQAALRFVELLFGLAPEAHVFLQRLMAGSYRRLVWQIVGRHFAGAGGLPHADDPRAAQTLREVEDEIREAALGDAPGGGCIERDRTVVARLHAHFGDQRIDETVMVARGLMAGTVGNVVAAVTTVVETWLAHRDGRRNGFAGRAARADDGDRRLRRLIDVALLRRPPAPFLARRATAGCGLTCDGRPMPEGAQMLLLMGVEPDRDLLFGGGNHLHRCIGRHLAEPLIRGIVRRVLRLPGLEQVLDPGTGRPQRPKKLWGTICESYPLQYARHRRLVQQPLFVVLPIRRPVRENAERLRALTAGGACIVEDALNSSRHVHFASFNIIEGGTHLAMSTVFDGDFDAYVEYFATSVPLFDRQFRYLDVEQAFPIKDHPKQFVDNIRKYNRAPLGGYFYSAYPRTTVADIDNHIPRAALADDEEEGAAP